MRQRRHLTTSGSATVLSWSSAYSFAILNFSFEKWVEILKWFKKVSLLTRWILGLVGARPARCDVGALVWFLWGQREPRPRWPCPARALRPWGQGLCKTHSLMHFHVSKKGFFSRRCDLILNMTADDLFVLTGCARPCPVTGRWRWQAYRKFTLCRGFYQAQMQWAEIGVWGNQLHFED